MDDAVRRFMAAVPADRKPLFDRLHALIMGLYPEAMVKISYGVPTYRARSGWVALGYWKGGVSLYTDGPHNIAGFQAAHPAIRTGTGCINFKLSDTIPVADLKKVIRRAIERSK